MKKHDNEEEKRWENDDILCVWVFIDDIMLTIVTDITWRGGRASI